MTIKQFNTIEPQTFEANRTQVNINVVPSSRVVDGETVNGYEYTTVVFEDSMLYTDEALLERAKKQEALEYLASTDWYIVRFMDSGVEVPQEIKDKRAEARLLV